MLSRLEFSQGIKVAQYLLPLDMAKKQIVIPESSLDFLKLLRENNNRDWFNAHKDVFLTEQAHIEQFANALLTEMNVHDLIETPSGKKSLHRIYRDTRFSKEKIPYKNNWSGRFSRATKQLRGGYYFHIEPGNSFVAGGFFAPNADDLKRVREDISFDPAPLRAILNDKTVVETFGALDGERLKTTPKGFDAEDEAIDLLRYKQFLLVRHFSDADVTGANFLREANQTFKNMRPFFDYMSQVLTTDGDGLDV
jgi:uncharacterized protein (TIGR02453 family)